MEVLEGLPIGSLGASGVVLLVVLLIIKGKLAPRSVIDDLRADRDSRILELTTERDDWKAAYQNSEESRRVLIEQNAELVELARTGTAVLQNLPGAKTKISPGES